MTASSRYALYFAPSENDPLWWAGTDWLGRDAASGTVKQQPSLDGLDEDAVEAATSAPRFYGFHATLKPPFSLKQGTREAELIAAAEAFGRTQAAFTCPPLRVQRLGRFIALMLSAKSAEMDALADNCVRSFDRFRAPLSEADMQRRRAAGLSDRQNRYLQQWGYPYVFEEFRFHMSLTGGIDDESVLGALESQLERVFAPFAEQTQPVDSVCVFFQPDRDTAFTLLHRVALQGRD